MSQTTGGAIIARMLRQEQVEKFFGIVDGTYTQLFAAARILAMGKIPRGNRIAIVSNGHGPGLLAADAAGILLVPDRKSVV
mgnify:CR=1 FL=1